MKRLPVVTLSQYTNRHPDFGKASCSVSRLWPFLDVCAKVSLWSYRNLPFHQCVSPAFLLLVDQLLLSYESLMASVKALAASSRVFKSKRELSSENEKLVTSGCVPMLHQCSSHETLHA